MHRRQAESGARWRAWWTHALLSGGGARVLHRAGRGAECERAHRGEQLRFRGAGHFRYNSRDTASSGTRGHGSRPQMIRTVLAAALFAFIAAAGCRAQGAALLDLGSFPKTTLQI